MKMNYDYSFKIILSFFLLILIGCSPYTRTGIDKEYSENLTAKRKHLFWNYDTGNKLEKGTYNISLTGTRVTGEVEDVFNDVLVTTNDYNSNNTFYQNSTIYETKNTEDFSIFYQFTDRLGFGIGGSISHGNNEKNIQNIPILSENITNYYVSFKYGILIDETINGLFGGMITSNNLKTYYEITEENNQSLIYKYATDYLTPNNKLLFTLNKNLNKNINIFIGAQTSNRIYKLITNKNVEAYSSNIIYVQDAIQSVESENIIYLYTGWELFEKNNSGLNTSISMCIGYPIFNEKLINGGLTLGVKVSIYKLPSN